jgi:hypothetical protein
MLRQDSLYWPSVSATVVYSSHLQAKPYSPFILRHRFSIKRQFDRSTCISQLFFLGLPATVARLIVAVVVETTERMMRRTLAHIGHECLEAILPTVTHRNATSAVVSIIHRIRIKTPRLRCAPRTILTAKGLAVCQMQGSGKFVIETAAAASISGSQGIASNNALVAAITPAHPSGTPTAIAGSVAAFDDCQSVESLTGQVSKFAPRHDSSIAQNRRVLTGEWPNEMNA